MQKSSDLFGQKIDCAASKDRDFYCIKPHAGYNNQVERGELARFSNYRV